MWGWIATVAGWLCLGVAAWAAAPTEPPAWQNELNALRLSDAGVALLPPERAAEADDADRRLGELYHELAIRYPREAVVRKAAGDHFWRTGQAELATVEWEAAQALNPADAETASALGSAWLRAGQARAACEQFRRAVAVRPGLARYHFELGNVLYLFRHQLTGLPDLPDEPAVIRASLRNSAPRATWPPATSSMPAPTRKPSTGCRTRTGTRPLMRGAVCARSPETRRILP